MDQPRKTRKRFEQQDHARFLTFSCHERNPLLAEADARDAVANQLMLTRERLKIRVLAWVLMPEHVHVLLMPGEVRVPQVLMAFKRPVATKLLNLWRERNDERLAMATRADGSHRFWQAGGGYDRNVFTREELIEKIRYIHENPVQRGLVESPTEWAWSSARAWVGAPTRWPELDRV